MGLPTNRKGTNWRNLFKTSLRQAQRGRFRSAVATIVITASVVAAVTAPLAPWGPTLTHQRQI